MNIAEASFLGTFWVFIGFGPYFATLMWRYDYRHFQILDKWLLVGVVVLMILPKAPGFGVSVKGYDWLG